VPPSDVVHGTNFVVPPVRRPSTLTVHDCWCAREPGRCPPVVEAAVQTVQRAVERGAWLHVTTHWGAQEVREVYGAERIRVVPLGVPPVPPAGPPPIDGRYVLALSTIEPRKGHEALVRSFASIAGEHPELKLVLAGAEGPAVSAVEREIEKADLGERVVRLPYVDDDTRAALLRGAWLLAQPSLYEGFGITPLEAMSVGVPVVATAAGAVEEVLGDAAVIVPVGDDDALAAAILEVATDEDLQHELVTRGHDRAALYTWEACARGMVDLWRAAVAAGF
jgi:glycosyltransferase involved in cell wall biosynthesis